MVDPVGTPLRMASKSLLILPNLTHCFSVCNNFSFVLQKLTQ